MNSMAEVTPEQVVEKGRERFREFLVRKGLRVTNQRMAILDAAFGHSDHFTAEELLDTAREIDRSVSRATVYRSLPILTESGLVREIDVGRDYKFYLANKGTRTEQAQVVCQDCDRIFEIDAPFMEWYANSVAGKVGLEPQHIRLQVHSRCIKFRETGVCENRVDR
jgi:Fe2+ or Zn2+ uptake regulation protein